MVDRISKEKRSKIMSAIRSRNTMPEIILRKALFARGLRFRTDYGKERIDIAFPGKKIAVFVDGCFWHGCPIHSHTPKSNEAYWTLKLRRNMERDIMKNERLRETGWKVIRFWEHELSDINLVLERIDKAILEKKQ
jgi:DNA mismatch endonuclease (patch repair protein)